MEHPLFLESKWPNDLAGEGRWPPFLILAERIPRYIFGANLVILAQIHYKLSCRQAKFPRFLCQNGQNDLEGQIQWPPFSTPAESIPVCMFGANLVILAQFCDQLSCGQGKVYGQTDWWMERWTDGRTDRRTDRHRQRQYPFGLKGKGVKTVMMPTFTSLLAQVVVITAIVGASAHEEVGTITTLLF